MNIRANMFVATVLLHRRSIRVTDQRELVPEISASPQLSSNGGKRVYED
jgi:hypothetical protein